LLLHRSAKNRHLIQSSGEIKMRDRLKGDVLTLRELRRAELPEAANLLARGMFDNPIIKSAFRISDTERRTRALERFFVPVLGGLYQRGVIGCALCDGSLVGVCGMVPPGNCRPKALEMLAMLPPLVARNRIERVLRIMRCVREWARRDLAEPHWHLGPVAVDPRLQGHGIGTALLTSWCSRINDHSMLSYLETDKYKNVPFYRKFGFNVIAEVEVLGVLTWFMSRPGVGSAPSVVHECPGSTYRAEGIAAKLSGRSVSSEAPLSV